jgi:hypothetical protein
MCRGVCDGLTHERSTFKSHKGRYFAFKWGVIETFIKKKRRENPSRPMF